MLGWFRRKEGFEWHKYVRTTIKLRRQDRRRKVGEAGEAVVKGIGDAGRSTVAAGEGVLSAIWRGVQTASSALGRGIGTLGAWLASALPERLSNRFSRMALATGLPTQWLLQPATRLGAAFVAVAAAAYGLARFQSVGFGGDVMAPLAVALVAALVAAAPWLSMHVFAPLAQSARRGVDAAARAPLLAPVAARLSGGGRWLAAGLAGTVIVAVAWAGWRHAPALPTLSGLSVMSSPPPVEGRAIALAGDRLRLGDRILKLDGIEAPESGQRCPKPGNKRWRCGAAATEALALQLRGRQVSCVPGATDAGGRILAQCSIDGQDVAGMLVQQGHVFSAGSLFSRYGTLEAEARSRKVGLWASEAERPAEYRAKLWDEARRKAPTGCPIKGQVTSDGAREYVVPWSSSYARVRVRQTRGERWFCSEQEAMEAGFKPSQRS